MTRYHMTKDQVIGNTYVKEEAYDLLETIILSLGEPENDADCSILNLLNTLFSPSVLPDEKKNVLSKKYNIAMTAELESEVQRMCNLSTAIANEAARNKSLQTAKKLLLNGKLNFEEIAEVTGLTVDEVKEIDKKKSA